MEYNYNECTTKALEEEQARIADQYKTITDEINKRKQEEAEKKKRKRAEEIREAGQHYDELMQDFFDDYGYFPDNFWTWFFKR